MLEDVYWKLRQGKEDGATLGALLRDVDVFFDENLLYVRTADSEVLAQYLLALQCLRTATRLPVANEAVDDWESIETARFNVFADGDSVSRAAADLRSRLLSRMHDAFRLD